MNLPLDYSPTELQSENPERKLIDDAEIYYFPFFEDQLRTTFTRIQSNADDDIYTFFGSIVTPFPGTIITYDHGEDDYEDVTAVSPIQSTTEVWGDGDCSNGFVRSCSLVFLFVCR